MGFHVLLANDITYRPTSTSRSRRCVSRRRKRPRRSGKARRTERRARRPLFARATHSIVCPHPLVPRLVSASCCPRCHELLLSVVQCYIVMHIYTARSTQVVQRPLRLHTIGRPPAGPGRIAGVSTSSRLLLVLVTRMTEVQVLVMARALRPPFPGSTS